MNDQQRDELLVELRQDIKWIKSWISEQNKYKLMIWSALIAAVIAMLK